MHNLHCVGTLRLELDDATLREWDATVLASGPNGIVPTRASRRATATLAHRITEARLRSEERERARKKNAA